MAGLEVRLVTVSASYGAGGSVIAPRLAEALGLPFADRLLPADAIPGGAQAEHATEQERTASTTSGLLDRLEYLTAGLALSFPTPAPVDVATTIRDQSEALLTEMAEGAGAVVLGRAAQVVLAGHPGAFHVRLHGPAERRVRRGMAIQHVDEATARRRLHDTDKARDRYMKRLYGRDVDDPTLYHLVLDATVLRLDAAVEVVAGAARAFWSSRAVG